MLGNEYSRALGFYQDEKDEKAIKVIESIDFQEDSQLLILYSEILLNPSKGKPKKKSIKKGISFLEKSLGLGEAMAGYELGCLYAYSDDLVKEDLDLAENYWIQGFKLGDNMSANELLSYYKRLNKENFDLQIQLAESLLKDPELSSIGYLNLGRIYLTPECNKYNIQLGVKNYEYSANEKSIAGSMKLMQLYYLGELVERDLEKCIFYCNKAEENDTDDLFSSEIIFWKSKLNSHMSQM